MKMLHAVDLFAGCGGLSPGFQNAGIDVRAAFEYWETAAHCYEQNFTHPVYRVDLSDTDAAVKLITPYKPDLIIGGPPCQDFSHAGKRVEAGRASLTGSYATIISKIKPRYFVMENVDRAEKSHAYSFARETFKSSGYGLTEVVLDASLCGVPQKRKRFFCIGILNGNDEAVREIVTRRMSEKEMTLRDYFGESLDFEYYYRHPRNYSRRAIFSIDEPAPTMRGVNRPVPKGYPGHANDACPLNESIRALTTKERAMIQTFPDSFVWDGSKTDTEQMIGNAVPVKLAEFVAASLLTYIKENAEAREKPEFLDWLIEEQNFSERSAKDVISRCKRAEKIVSAVGIPDAYYIFTLEQQAVFQNLSVNVKSQMKRALKLQEAYSQK
jgi:DNA (cytosine-5)-methyltransferase 1